jgi:enoyl-CoA hydratase
MVKPVTYTLDTSGGTPVGIIRLDDKKANAFGFDLIAAFESALDIAEQDDSKALVIIGNNKAFSAGFDLAVMGNKDATQSQKDALLHGGGMLVMRVYGFRKPVVLGVTGHALALGAILLFAGDIRVGPAEAGVAKPAKIGMNEVAIGMTLPKFAIELAKARVPVTELTKSLTQAKVYGPEEAVLAGYLDLLAPSNSFDDVLSLATEEARRLGGYVKQPAFHRQKLMERGAAIDTLVSGLVAEREAQLQSEVQGRHPKAML